MFLGRLKGGAPRSARRSARDARRSTYVYEGKTPSEHAPTSELLVYLYASDAFEPTLTGLIVEQVSFEYFETTSGNTVFQLARLVVRRRYPHVRSIGDDAGIWAHPGDPRWLDKRCSYFHNFFSVFGACALIRLMNAITTTHVWVPPDPYQHRCS